MFTQSSKEPIIYATFIYATPEVCTNIMKGYYPYSGLRYPDASPCCKEFFRCQYQNPFLYHWVWIMD